MSTPSPELTAKLAHLKRILSDMGSMVVAFSGGVDSTFALRVATDVPGLDLLAVTTDSPTNTDEEITEARSLASEFGAMHQVESVNELDTPGYAENPTHRCYLCKQTLYPLCRRIAADAGLAWVVDGVNTDDLGDYRPGLKAAEELGVRHPLVEAGLDKNEIRELSAYYGLRTADRPASPCLSSRFPYGTAIDKQRLEQVATAEAFMRELGFIELRVRHLGSDARVEVAGRELARLEDTGLCQRITDRLRELGFSQVDISAVPLRSGSLNDVIV
jgi:uncharacterized protein